MEKNHQVRMIEMLRLLDMHSAVELKAIGELHNLMFSSNVALLFLRTTVKY